MLILMWFIILPINFKSISANNSKESQPWCDTCLVAKKRKSFNNPSTTLEDRVSILENKVGDLINIMKK